MGSPRPATNQSYLFFSCPFELITHRANQTNYLFIWYELSSNDLNPCHLLQDSIYASFSISVCSTLVGACALVHIMNVLAFATANVQTLTLQSILIHFHLHTIKSSNLFKSNENIVTKSQFYWSKLFPELSFLNDSLNNRWNCVSFSVCCHAFSIFTSVQIHCKWNEIEKISLKNVRLHRITIAIVYCLKRFTNNVISFWCCRQLVIVIYSQNVVREWHALQLNQ